MFGKKRDPKFDTKDGDLFVVFPWLEILRVLSTRNVPIYSAVINAGITVGSRPGSVSLGYLDEDETAYFQKNGKNRLEGIVEQLMGEKWIFYAYTREFLEEIGTLPPSHE